MAEAEIIKELAALVADSSQSISYKWLSRKFSVSSNAAKRLLEKFVGMHSGHLDVVYVLSGWTQEQPRSYSIQLVKGTQLEGAKASLCEDLSAHIYSVQGGSLGNPALLWNPDHAQAAKFFNDPPHVLNCLRDNRFSGVTCTFVTRDLKGKSVQRVPPKTAVAEEPKTVSKQALQPSEKAQAAKATHTSPAKVAGSSKASLQNLWNGRKQSPQKPVVPETTTTENNGSSDDEAKEFSRLRRAGNKRRIILDDDVSEGDDGPNHLKLADKEEVASLITPEKKVEDEKQPAEQSNNSKTEDLRRNVAEAGESKKRRRLVKTRIDERGREVTEVVWDTEGQTLMSEAKLENEKPKAETPAPPPPPKQPVKNKAPIKPGPKSGKGAKVGPQQGSITSFFKKQ